jgi:hypothetical protein
MSDAELSKAIYSDLNEDGKLRMKTVEYTIEFLKDRSINNFDAFNTVFEKVYNSLKNGVTAEQDNGTNRKSS